MTPERVHKPFPWRCPKCLKREVYAATLRDYSTRVKHDGRVHDVMVGELTVAKCRACGEAVFSNETDEQISRALRDQLGLLQPEQIRELRGSRFTQQGLADLLGTAPETISRWETGTVIQSRAMDKFLRLFLTVPEVEEALRHPRTMSTWARWTDAVLAAENATHLTGMVTIQNSPFPSAFDWPEDAGFSCPSQSLAPADSRYPLAA